MPTCGDNHRMIRTFARLSLFASLIAAAAAHAQMRCSDLPVLLIVQDKSGSMNQVPNPANTATPTKWASAQTAVPQLVQQFANRFDFGVFMFPGATTQFNCTTGAVVSAVPSSPTQVQTVYTNAVPGGGTPTATSLLQAKAYIQSLNLGPNRPAYVLLLTDGLPNCNLALNTSTCMATTPSCATAAGHPDTICNLGAKDCLDDQGTSAAAASLLSAGIKTFVVGFDATLTSGNNKAVLDAIAAAGGTTSAYVANNQTALTTAMNQIALNTATCCKDVCTAGAAVCAANNTRQVCQLDTAIGCNTWVSNTCPANSTCTSGTCQACTTSCTLGAKRCANGNGETCVALPTGCTGWQVSEVCDYGELCSNGTCSSCQACTNGATRCTANGIEECTWNVTTGCTSWSARTCPSGSTCNPATNMCASCNATCTVGSKRCTGKTPETCVADASGCTSWSAGTTCTTFCSGGSCGTCGTTCTPGATRCNGNGVETCSPDGNGCNMWSSPMACAANSVCANGSCQACATTCTQGSKRCGANGTTEECRLTASGCNGWVMTGQCQAGETCNTGVCVPMCNDVCTEGAARCTNGAPEKCEKAPTGCTIWRPQTACTTNELCVSGSCAPKCGQDEFNSCPTGTICTGTPEGDVCLPYSEPDAGSMGTHDDAGAGGGNGNGEGLPDAGRPKSSLNGDGLGDGKIVAMPGCGCNGVDGSLMPLAGLMLLALRRRVAR